jgi:hypothetical protein
MRTELSFTLPVTPVATMPPRITTPPGTWNCAREATSKLLSTMASFLETM